ncbi:MAG: DotU family type IV/VI secretion system protein [Deltaproteobacteria bacterium]|nr:DotU family type IV/VI secretion system protein [Deltaproteobacteria bacterium]MBW2318350.1 DotU family type IV/VI secretion system protein [Deltaproteobacteria bacterium]MBW2600816.1 DotU family type IV/VI secretion system protein [Deltaproteobacteria bacterium]
MRLTDCFIDVIAYVAYFLKTVASKQPPFDQVKADIQRLMGETEESRRQGAFSQEDYDLARFAICAWVDEVILGSSWNERNKWQGEQLQRLYYQTSDAGEMFFDRLNAIGPHQRDVREIYYLCLAMGFAGRYCNEGDEYLLGQLKTSNLKLLTGSSVGIPSLERTELFPEAYPVDSEEVSTAKGKFRFSGFTLLCLGGPVGLFIVLFFIYQFILGSVGETILK